MSTAIQLIKDTGSIKHQEMKESKLDTSNTLTVITKERIEYPNILRRRHQSK